MMPLALRIDDIGAASKRNEVYSKYEWRWRRWRVSGNWLFIKYLPRYRAWGVYREMRPAEWEHVFRLLEQYRAKLTVGITATWVETPHDLTPFPQKFPAAAAILKQGADNGLIEIANHGLTHCVLSNAAYKPKWFSGNRTQHREFWDWLPPEIHDEHLRRSQDILQTYFQRDIVTLVPPGNVFSDATLAAAMKYGIQYVSCQTPPRQYETLQILGNEQVLAFHDRELVLEGVGWLEKTLQAHADKAFCFVRELPLFR